MAKPKRKKILLIIIIILTRINLDLDNDVTTGINFELDDTFKQVRAALDSTDEDGWDQFQMEVYEKAAAVGEQLELEQDPTTALTALQGALG